MRFSFSSPLLGRFAALAAFLIPLATSGQEELPVGLGFIRFVNATGAPGKLMVLINGMEADPAGYGDGEATGSLGLPPTSYKVELKHGALGEEKVPVEVKMGEVTTVIALAVPKGDDKEPAKGQAKDKETEKPNELGHHLHFAPVSAPGAESSTLTLLQFTPSKELAMSVSGVPCPTRKGEPATVAITKAIGAFPEVHLAGSVVCLLNFKFPADQLVVFFTGEGGVLKHAQLRNDVQ
jgi:hypothetical protein